jgi:hypothetical protein
VTGSSAEACRTLFRVAYDRRWEGATGFWSMHAIDCAPPLQAQSEAPRPAPPSAESVCAGPGLFLED